ncbi:MAG: 1,4-alpha-glucan branching protein GlgB [Ruminococcaceae bacterium]|nr:1,4-alpha-glucan branching protein GlgB [Oscillospiraceae bacterium]
MSDIVMNDALYFFHQGTNYRAYEYLGVHRENNVYVFRVWAPNAESVFLVGDFNDWDYSMPMTRISEAGVYEVYDTQNRVESGHRYKFKIINHGREFLKSDPYAFKCELPPNTASVVPDREVYSINDKGWRKYAESVRDKLYELPMNIYEVHLHSWRRRDDGSYMGYREIAEELSVYVKQMGYTHIEIMPITEHPYDGSWGYQVCGYYAPTSRFGTPNDFKAFVDKMHEAGIGVIMDWVPAHFPKDAHGLYEFDGQPLYEYQGADRIEHAGWGTRRFDVGRNEVQSFLVSNALYWLEEYHIDALRVDAVASMLYLDYDRLPGEWIPNVYGDNRCLEAIAFFKKLNSAVKQYCPWAIMIAEESTAWSNITGFDNDGLGFDFKWNMGWMNDTLSYAELDPVYRSYHHDKLTFSLTYAFGEKYILPISHDEVVHGKRSFLDKMSGDYWQKFAGARAFLAYMMTHPGKKLTFMGNEIAQFREWDFEGEIEWFMLDYDSHASYQRYVAELNRLYLENPPLWQDDISWDGFRWIDADNREQSIISYRRVDKSGKELIILLNFTPVAREDFLLGVPESGTYEEIFNSDRLCFGGSGVTNEGDIPTTGQSWNYLADSVRIRIPPLGVTVLRKKSDVKKKRATQRKRKNS